MVEKNNSKKRMVASILLATILAGGLGVYFLSGNTAQKEAVVENSTINTNIGGVEAIPGQSDDFEHNEIQKEANKINYEKSKEEGVSFVPKLVNETVKKEEFIEPPTVEEVKEQPEPVVEEPELIEPTPTQEPPKQVVPEKPPVQEVKMPTPTPTLKYEVVLPKAEVKQEVDDELVKSYEDEIKKLQALWDKENSVNSKSAMVVEKSSQDLEKNTQEQSQVSQFSSSSDSGSSTSTSSFNGKNGPLYVRATTIVPAVMITSVNTDEPGPVMAEIVSGPLKGARVLGSVVNAPTDVTDNIQKATIQFTTIQRKEWDQSYSINVFAVDPSTSRTAVASSVDNHYFKRYGLGLAAAFLEGLGSAYSNTGKQVTYTDSATVVSMANSAKEINRSALGNVGTKLGQEISKISDVPATIYVDSGESIGLLFMADF